MNYYMVMQYPPREDLAAFVVVALLVLVGLVLLGEAAQSIITWKKRRL